MMQQAVDRVLSQNFELVGALTFGRDIAQFKQMVAFLSILSIVLWTLVVVSTVLRTLAYIFWHSRQPENKEADL